MAIGQIIFYLFIAIAVILFIRKSLVTRSLKQYSAPEVKNRLSSRSGDFVMLDVRTKAERAERHIKGSMHIPLNELYTRINELSRVKDKEIICYCRSGNRSSTAAMILKKKGFRSANMKGGMLSWDSGQV